MKKQKQKRKPRITCGRLDRLLAMLAPRSDYRKFRSAVQQMVKRGVPSEQLVSRMISAGFPRRFVYDALAERSIFDLSAQVLISSR